VKRIIVSLEEKVKELLERCKETVAHSFRTFTTARTRAEVVVLFLAVLHLLKGRAIDVEQKEHFSDIIFKQRILKTDVESKIDELTHGTEGDK